ncbi:hypothetical protein BD626DRAFT_516871 [Schizophyllum amplum]|uniref:Uncharacterized protein n=1 Tax=Schizophyllum amplum TaxID=97359 RepID=A0A550BWK1_9AGAR|nr:hypothetical protein BD626DRAFT_516871 [Auriculariopsis ampla]
MSRPAARSRGGFLRFPDETPKIMNRRGPLVSDICPKYVFGWILSPEDLDGLSMDVHGRPDCGMHALSVIRDRWAAEESGKTELRQAHIRMPSRYYHILLYITDNTTLEKRDLHSDEETMEKVKRLIGKKEDGRWYHFDTF